MAQLVPVIGPGLDGNGSGYVIGDHLVLTAGHLAFEYDGNQSNPQITTNQSIAWDGRNYFGQYQTRVAAEISGGSNPSPMFIENKLYASDMVAVTVGSAAVGANSDGLAVFLADADLIDPTAAIGTTTRIIRKGLNTATKVGAISNVTADTFDFSRVANTNPNLPGDSGGAYLVSVGGGRDFVIGTQSSNRGNPPSTAIGTHFKEAEWRALTDLALLGKSGNVSGREPVNLLVGTTAGATLHGSARPDIVIGRDGDDTLDGGDPVAKASGAVWADDQLFGGNGDDVFKPALGNDLLHGGKYVPAGGVKANLETDGKDSVDYSAVTASTPAKGIRIVVGQSTAAGAMIYQANPDFASASFVEDLGRDLAVDTLVSIEKVTATDANDTLKINGFDAARIGGANGLGGIAEVDLGKDKARVDQGGDIIDLSDCTEAAKVVLSGANPYVSSVANEAATKVVVRGAEHVIGSAHNDDLRGNGTGVILEGGAGDDTFQLYDGDIAIGGAGKDKFYVYSDRSKPNGTYSGPSRILLLDFDADDELYLDGERYTGYDTTVTNSPNVQLDYQYSAGYDHTLGVFYSSSASRSEQADPDAALSAQLTGRLQLMLQKNQGATQYVEVDIAGFQPEDGGIKYKLAYEQDAYDNPQTNEEFSTAKAGYTNGLDFGDLYKRHPNAELGPIVTEPYLYEKFEFADWADKLPVGLANRSSYVGMLVDNPSGHRTTAEELAASNADPGIARSAAQLIQAMSSFTPAAAHEPSQLRSEASRDWAIAQSHGGSRLGWREYTAIA